MLQAGVVLKSRFRHLRLLVSLACFLCAGGPAFADDPAAALGLTEGADAPAARAPRPSSKIAENQTVVTADDIARLDAHTLADILQTIPGIQLDYQRTPGTFTFFNVQGAFNNNVLVLIDGVRQNDYQLGKADPNLIPVQMIERIEIVKGAASAAWGPALGGVVNIVTKSPDWERPAGGMAAGSFGKRATADGRLELSGARKTVGYYLAGGQLRSDGLQPNNDAQLNHGYLKVVRRDEAGGTLTASGFAVNDHYGSDEGLWQHSWPVHDDGSNSLGQLSLNYARPLAPRLTLDLDGHLRKWKGETDLNDRIDGENVPFAWTRVRESEHGAGIRLTWGDNRRSLVVGTEYAHAGSKSELVAPVPTLVFEKDWDRWEAYANGVLSIGHVTVLPGVRYDRTGLAGGIASATLGVTWQATERTLLRGYGARGYSPPSALASEGRLMKVYAAQAGFETADIPYVWFKGTWFYNRLRDIESVAPVTLTNQDRQGVEFEGRTSPWHGLSLTGGYTYTDVRDADTGVRLETDSSRSVPPHVVKAGVRYDDAEAGLRGTLTANWVSWNQSATSLAAARGAVWDLHLSWKVRPQDDLSPELFASGRNLFSNVQTTSDDLYANTSAWFEGGLRWRF